MTLDDLYAAPFVGANRHAFELFGNMRPSTQEEIDAYNKMLVDMGIPFQANLDDVMAVAERIERQKQIEYDEYVVATPKSLTSDDLTENHAAGIPITRDHIVRCKDCEFYQRNDRCGGALQCLNERFIYGKWGASVEPDFFCADGKPREVE